MNTVPAYPDHVYFTVDDLEAALDRCRKAGCQKLDDTLLPNWQYRLGWR